VGNFCPVRSIDIFFKEDFFMSANVVAPMPGTITEILVNVGDQVQEDDEVLILEAMKMENPICAPSAGKIKEIKVGAKDKVDTNQVLVVIE